MENEWPGADQKWIMYEGDPSEDPNVRYATYADYEAELPADFDQKAHVETVREILKQDRIELSDWEPLRLAEADVDNLDL